METGLQGHVYFDPVRRNIVFRILQFLKKNNPLYHDIDINLINILLPSIITKNETFFSGANIPDYVAPDELIPIAIERLWL